MDIQQVLEKYERLLSETENRCVEMLFSELEIGLTFGKMACDSRSLRNMAAANRQIANARMANAAILKYLRKARPTPEQKERIERGLAELHSLLSSFGRETAPVAAKKALGRREKIDTGTDKRFVKRDAKAKFKESADTTLSLRKDVKQPAKRKVRSGYGDRGERSRLINSSSREKELTSAIDDESKRQAIANLPKRKSDFAYPVLSAFEESHRLLAGRTQAIRKPKLQ